MGLAVNSRVLVIEDHPMDRELVVELVMQEGYAALEADSAEVGLGMAFAERPALILMDLQLPRMSGFEAIRRLRADPTTAHIPILALTASVVGAGIRKAGEAGADACLIKPLDTSNFRETLHRLLASGTAG
ncbi:MAG: response regulator [Candidatus Methylomirabilota bacterium]